MILALNLKRLTPYLMASVVFLILLALNWPSDDNLAAASTPQPQIDTYVSNLQQRQFDTTGRLLHHLTATGISISHDDVTLIEPTITLVSAQQSWLIKSRFAKVDRDYHVFELSDEVKVLQKGNKPLQLDAEQLTYVAQNQTLSSAKNVVLRDNDLVLYAGGIELDMANNRYQLLGGINAQQPR